jgi:hypothetical protein
MLNMWSKSITAKMKLVLLPKEEGTIPPLETPLENHAYDSTESLSKKVCFSPIIVVYYPQESLSSSCFLPLFTTV